MLARHTWKAAGLVAGSAAYVWNRLATRTPANSEEEHAQYQMKVSTAYVAVVGAYVDVYLIITSPKLLRNRNRHRHRHPSHPQ